MVFHGLHLSPQVYWRPVFWGIGLQFLLGLLILRTRPGFVAFDWMGKQVQVSGSNESWWADRKVGRSQPALATT